MYGSIGAEPHSGLPYWMWKTLPSLYPAEFEGRNDYSAFGFLYEKDADGQAARPADRHLAAPGAGRSTSSGSIAAPATSGRGARRRTCRAHIVPGMPSNNLNLHRFIRFVLNLATDERLSPDNADPGDGEAEGAHFDWLDKLAWRYAVLPRVREGLVEHQSRLKPLLDKQPAWGPGRVDTFNPYKLLLELPAGSRVPDAELVGTADFPAIFNQRPREGMKLHWDGDNDSLAERNLSAAVGAGVTPDSVDHASIERDAAWLMDLKPPPSPYHPDPAAVERGKAIYMQACAALPRLAGPQRLRLRRRQDRAGRAERGPRRRPQPAQFLHAEVPRLADLDHVRGHALPFHPFRQDGRLRQSAARRPYGCARPTCTTARCRRWPTCSLPPDRRPKAFVRGSDVIDPVKGGFVAPRLHAGRGRGQVLLRHGRARQQRARPRIRNRSAGRPEAGSPGLFVDVLSGGEHERRVDHRLEPGPGRRRARSIYQKVLGFNMLLHLGIGLLCMFAPAISCRTSSACRRPFLRAGFAAGARRLILVTALYIPGLQDPLRSRYPNIVGVLGRIWMATVWFVIGGGFVWFGLFDVFFALLLAWLYYRYCVAELMTRP